MTYVVTYENGPYISIKIVQHYSAHISTYGACLVSASAGSKYATLADAVE